MFPNNLPLIKELDNAIEEDYIWFRACEINKMPTINLVSRQYMHDQLRQLSITPESVSYMRDNKHFDDKNAYNTERFIKTLRTEFDRTCLTDDYFQWIDNKNKRLLCYIWKLLDNHVHGNKTVGASINHLLPILLSPNNLTIRAHMPYVTIDNINKNDIIHRFNRLDIGKNTKQALLEQIQYHAGSSLKHKEIVRWLKTDVRVKLFWLQDYLSKNMSNYTARTVPGSSRAIYEIISFFDILCTFNEDRFRLTTIQMKKAWNQRTYRENNKNKKQYSINMSNDIGDILDEISIKRNENKNAIVEALIRAEYEKISK